jgi:hypothetical protein
MDGKQARSKHSSDAMIKRQVILPPKIERLNGYDQRARPAMLVKIEASVGRPPLHWVSVSFIEYQTTSFS